MELIAASLAGLGFALFMVLLFPVVWLVGGLVMACLAPLFLRPSPSVARTSFDCPFSGRRVRTEFLTRDGADRPADIVSCSAFNDPRCIRCKKECLRLAVTACALSPMMPRFSLIAGGTAYRVAP